MKSLEEDLRYLRKEIDNLDEQIKNQLIERFRLIEKIMLIKKELKSHHYDLKREVEIMEMILKDVPINYHNHLKNVFEKILDESRSLQINSRVNKNFIMNQIKQKLFTRFQKIIIILFFFLLVGLGYYTFFTSLDYSLSQPLLFEIKKGESFDIISNKLYQKGIIKSIFLFKLAAFIYGADNKIKAARFKIFNGLSYLDLLDLFVNGPADYLKTIKIHEGFTLKKISQSLHLEIKIDSSTFIRKALDKNFISEFNIDSNSLEGYLLPGIYHIYENSSIEEVVSIILDSLNSFWNDSLENQSIRLNMNKHKILTLASIIEGETNYVGEMNLISAVYHNRLKKGMKLQADPTVQYALNENWRRLTYSDLKVNSPYNTYLFYGLPPGPINNPSKDAIIAALYPADVDYYFFVADGTGKHKFAKTYSEHLLNVKEYRKWLKTKNSN
jgi:UPF0755 protein